MSYFIRLIYREGSAREMAPEGVFVICGDDLSAISSCRSVRARPMAGVDAGVDVPEQRGLVGG